MLAMLLLDVKALFNLSTVPYVPTQSGHLIEYAVKQKINFCDLFDFNHEKEINSHLFNSLVDASLREIGINQLPFDVVRVAICGFYEDQYE